MRVSAEKMLAEAQATGFRPDVLEKVAHLLGLLNAIRSHPFLRGKLALKGGTALNLFVFDVPRLSVDIDLNYVGTESRLAMLEERPRLEDALQAVFSREDFTIRRMPSEHAGGKWSLRYPTAAGQSGRIDVDVNYMYRVSPVARLPYGLASSGQLAGNGHPRGGHPRVGGGQAGRAAEPSSGPGPVRLPADLLARHSGT